MYWSKTLIPTLKETPQEAESVSHQLLLRAGFIRMLMSGVYAYLPLGYRALMNIEKIIREEMAACGAAEVLLPAWQPLDLWQKSGRDKDLGEVMVRFTDRRGRKICLGPTHEEVITDLVRAQVSSYKQLPLILYQIQTKFRDEIRPRFGLVRGCEFIMKDAYSFDLDQAGLDKNYQRMCLAYEKIFQRCGLDCLSVEADPGVMGGNVSHEFMVPATLGEDIVLYCGPCKMAFPFKENPDAECLICQGKLEKVNTLEVGHVFKLGTKYSGVMGANFVDCHGSSQPIVMGCYGIGVSRLVSAVIEQNHDAAGIIWPKEVSPYQVLILPLDVSDSKNIGKAKEICGFLEKQNISVLLDDRDERAGVKFKDADLLGLTLQIVIGKESLKNNTLELKVRLGGEKTIASEDIILQKIKEILHG